MKEQRKVTGYGVTHDIRNSPYTYDYLGVTWHFSSDRRRMRFAREAGKRVGWVNDGLSRRFRCVVNIPILAAVQLYTQIEQGGFYAVSGSYEYTDPSQFVVAGRVSHGRC